MKKISFIIPAYNAEKVIEECIRSIIKIDCSNYEIVVVNDGSTDHTEEILKSYNDTRLKVIKQKNSGVSIARNKGLLEASGEYIAFVDADDTLESKEYEAFLKCDNFEKYDFVMFGYKIVNADKVAVDLPLPAGSMENTKPTSWRDTCLIFHFLKIISATIWGGKSISIYGKDLS